MLLRVNDDFTKALDNDKEISLATAAEVTAGHSSCNHHSKQKEQTLIVDNSM